MTINKIALFQGKRIRRTLRNDEWWFAINDVIEALTDSHDPAQYFKRLKQRDKELEKLTGQGEVQFVPPLRLEVETAGGRQKMYCWNTEGIFRLIQSIPSPKAEPLKRWLAKVGYERIQEIENPELATKRTRLLYKLKGLKRENLRDHMEDFELIFTMLGERATTEIHRNEDSRGVRKLKSDARAGGDIAGGARRKLEKRLGRSIVSRSNFKDPQRLSFTSMKPTDKTE